MKLLTLLQQWGLCLCQHRLAKLADNEAELASVIAHEIGHIASRHAVEQMRKQQSLVVLPV